MFDRSRHLGRVRISTALLLDALSFPEGTRVIACYGERADYPGEIELIVEHGDLPETPEAGHANLITPTFKQVGEKPAHWLEFDWGLD